MGISNKIQQKVITLIENCEIRKLCDECFGEKFLWVVKGSGMLSRTYTDKEEYFNKAFDRLSAVMQPNWRLQILNTYFTDDTLIIEIQGEGKAKNANHYNNEYCWFIKFEDDKIIKITAYLDTLLLDTILINNEIDNG
ncbi:MAG: hypothetical protein GY710_16890 [Desulfobacteraceae bacterium]|nr:hypothetical protein [Desulfobacteraceae bacterium]